MNWIAILTVLGIASAILAMVSAMGVATYNYEHCDRKEYMLPFTAFILATVCLALAAGLGVR